MSIKKLDTDKKYVIATLLYWHIGILFNWHITILTPNI